VRDFRDDITVPLFVVFQMELLCGAFLFGVFCFFLVDLYQVASTKRFFLCGNYDMGYFYEFGKLAWGDSLVCFIYLRRGFYDRLARN